MIELEIDGGDPGLAELIGATLHGNPLPDPASSVAQAGKYVREQQEEAEATRPSREQIETVNFALLDDESDFSDL